MEIEEKERKLHKVVAASGFLFVLMVLPLVQYIIVSGQADFRSSKSAINQIEEGQVAGVSSDQDYNNGTVNNAVLGISADSESVAKKYASVQDCQAQKAKDFDDLDRFANGKKIALKNKYEELVLPYKKGLEQLDIKSKNYLSERSALDQLINDQYRDYLRKLDEVERAVFSQKASIDSVDCSLE